MNTVDRTTIGSRKASAAAVRLSRWINEPPLPITELLSAHDVARLTRRPIWLLSGLALIGRFPRKHKYHGRKIGWCQADVLDWLARDLALAANPAPAPTQRRCQRRRPQQACLPLECRSSCTFSGKERRRK